jgi:hypothetical protein
MMTTNTIQSSIVPFTIYRNVPMSAIVTNLDNVYELQLVLPTRTITKYFDSEGELENELAKLPVESISYETMTSCGCSE